MKVKKYKNKTAKLQGCEQKNSETLELKSIV